MTSPAGLAVTLTFSIVAELPFGLRLSCAGWNWHVIPGGGFAQLSESVPSNVPELTVRLKVFELPTGIVAEVGETDPETVPPRTVIETEAVAEL